MRKAIIVDDDLINAKMMEVVLRKNHWECETILRDYSSILERNDLSDIELIMMDYNLEGCKGDQLIRQIRSETNYTSAIWLVSGSSNEKELQNSLEAGADRIVHKPINIGELSEMINSID